MSDVITLTATVKVHSPDVLAFEWGLEVVEITSFQVKLRMAGQEFTIPQGGTLQISTTINRKEIGGLLTENLVDSLDQIVKQARTRQTGWFGRAKP